MQQNPQNSSKTIFILTGVVLVAAAIYYFYYSGAATVTTGDSTLSGDSSQTVSSAEGQKVLNLLNEINSLQIDTKFFESPAYQSLVDFSVQIPPVPVGRPNPFSDFGSFVGNSSPASVPGSGGQSVGGQ